MRALRSVFDRGAEPRTCRADVVLHERLSWMPVPPGTVNDTNTLKQNSGECSR